MKLYSPLRYPGGKNRLAQFIASVCTENSINGHYIEPYAGGASVALYLLIQNCVEQITINDYDRSIYAFWYAALYETERFCKQMQDEEITIENWQKYKDIQRNKDKADVFDLGFSTFFLNRTNHSGIIDGGIIGGLEQKGTYKIDCRFNKQGLIERIRLIASQKHRINLYNQDALDLIKFTQKKADKNTIYYFDPPYLLKGPSLYLNHYKLENHREVAEEIKKIKRAKWIVSYDDSKEIEQIYNGCDSQEYTLLHTAREIRRGKEVLFFSNNLKKNISNQL